MKVSHDSKLAKNYIIKIDVDNLWGHISELQSKKLKTTLTSDKMLFD